MHNSIKSYKESKDIGWQGKWRFNNPHHTVLSCQSYFDAVKTGFYIKDNWSCCWYWTTCTNKQNETFSCKFCIVALEVGDLNHEGCRNRYSIPENSQKLFLKILFFNTICQWIKVKTFHKAFQSLSSSLFWVLNSFLESLGQDLSNPHI